MSEKEISLKKVRVESGKLVAPTEMPKEQYPNFSIYEDPPEELMKLNIGDFVTGKLRVSEKEIRLGTNARKSISFEAISVIKKDDTKEKT